ncbi:MAG: zinc ABC transporter substrate-binding protein [Bacteroidales bacterium]|jgi:zinc transport system substrate-binding protein|nr:zinc ABC transporter substrate-binding protein [Bacteroidales bacterium]
MIFITKIYLPFVIIKNTILEIGMIKSRFILLAAVLIMFSCSSNKKGSGSGYENKKKVITVSIVPQKFFVQKIAGNDVDINILVPPGTSPETGSLLPSQLKDIANSDIWFRMGHLGVEYSWHDKIAQANTKMKIVDLSEELDLITESPEYGKKVHEGGVDPHTWLSPAMVKQMAKKITNELILINPGKSDEYNLNYLEFAKEIDQLDIDIKNSLREYKGKKIVIFHPSLSYFASDYGLVQYSLETGGKEPTPQRMAEVVRMAKAENIKVIYVQSDFDQDNAFVFAEEMKGKVIALDLLSHEWEQNLRLMTKIFVDNF